MTAKVHRWSLETRIQTFLEAKAKDARQSSRRPPNQVALALVAAGNPDASIDRARLKFDVEVNPDIRLALSRSYRRAMVDIGHGSSALVEPELDVLLTT